MGQQWRYPLFPVVTGAGTAVTVTSTLTSGFGNQPLPQLPPIDRPGGRLIVEAEIEITSTGTSTVTFGLYFGTIGQAITSKTLVAATAAIATTASFVSWPCILRYSGRFRSTSPSAGTIYGQGEELFPTSLSAWGTSPFPVTAGNRTVSTLNTDQVNEIDLGITLSAANCSVLLTDFAAEYSG